jgi:hypothetical protein
MSARAAALGGAGRDGRMGWAGLAAAGGSTRPRSSATPMAVTAKTNRHTRMRLRRRRSPASSRSGKSASQRARVIGTTAAPARPG